MMQLGCDGVFVGSGIFKSSNPALLARAIVAATTHFNDPKVLAEVSTGLGPGMFGLDARDARKGDYVGEAGEKVVWADRGY